MKILFWDIDGTLLRTAKAGLYAFEQAARELYHTEADFSAIQSAGMTDNYIAFQIIRAATGQEPETPAIRRLVERYESLLPGYLAKHQGHLAPSVREILTNLQCRPDYLALLLTGNTRSGAQAKLSHYQIEHFFDFQLSAFADHFLIRNDIARQALVRLKDRIADVNPDHVYIIGDTPHDIECGKAIGARTIAVATGRFSRSELESRNPWLALDQLPSADRFTKIIEAE